MSEVLVETGPDAGLVSHLTNPLVEQRDMVAGRGAVALSNREVFTVSGPDRLGWLHSLTTQVFEGLDAGTGVRALVLSPTGHVEHVLHGVDDGDTLWAWTEPGRGQALVDWLDSMRFLLRVEVSLRPDFTVWWLGSGVGVPGRVDDAAVPVMDSQVADGHEVVVPRDWTPDDAVERVGVRAWEGLRLAAGVPRIGLDTDHRTVPNEIGLYATALDKGCYPGQETVARVHNLGRPPRRLTLLLLDGSAPELPVTGDPVTVAGRVVGQVGTVGVHHELGPLALALLRRSVDVDATVEVGAVSATQEVLVDPEVGLHVRPVL